LLSSTAHVSVPQSSTAHASVQQRCSGCTVARMQLRSTAPCTQRKHLDPPHRGGALVVALISHGVNLAPPKALQSPCQRKAPAVCGRITPRPKPPISMTAARPSLPPPLRTNPWPSPSDGHAPGPGLLRLVALRGGGGSAHPQPHPEPLSNTGGRLAAAWTRAGRGPAHARGPAAAPAHAHALVSIGARRGGCGSGGGRDGAGGAGAPRSASRASS